MAGAPSKPNQCILTMQTTDEDIAQRVGELLGTKVISHPPRQPHHKPSFVTRKRGQTAAALMRELRPLMSVRRQTQIDRALASQATYHMGRVLSPEAELELTRTTGKVKDICARFGISTATYFRIQARNLAAME